MSSSVLDSRRRQMLAQMGIKPLWQLREAPVSDVGETSPLGVEEAAPASTPTSVSPPELSSPAQEAPDWAALRTSVLACQACALGEAGGRAVMVEAVAAPVDCFILGEAPGAAELEAAEAVVGQRGQLLDAMLASIGLARGAKVYVSTAVKCRPAGDRAPELHELATCRAHLQQELALLRPRLIIALGRLAAQSVLEQEVRISAARGQTWQLGQTAVIVTYPLEYFLRKPEHKALAWEDMCRAQDILRAG